MRTKHQYHIQPALVSASAFGVGFAPLNATSRADAMKRINRALEPMRKLAPDSGAYANEVRFSLPLICIPSLPAHFPYNWTNHVGEKKGNARRTRLAESILGKQLQEAVSPLLPTYLAPEQVSPILAHMC